MQFDYYYRLYQQYLAVLNVFKQATLQPTQTFSKMHKVFILLALVAIIGMAFANPMPDPAVVYPYSYGYASPVVSTYGGYYPAYSGAYYFKK